MKTPADIRIEFEHKIRKAYVDVKALGWSDEEGIYKTEIESVWFDGTEVSDLLTEADWDDLNDAVEPAIHEDARDSEPHPGYGPYLR
jgi:hypothetical protein